VPRTFSKYTDPTPKIDPADAAVTPCDPTASGCTAPARAVWRWADPDAGGSGISGPGAGTRANPYVRWVNQNAELGGSSTCPWTTNNCGLNDEPFGFHPKGCNSVFADGSVHFLGEQMAPVVMRDLVARADGDSINADDMPR
jgi:prepilin-type processing-associated H-X9-DG protein